jgi:hypothetical protein
MKYVCLVRTVARLESFDFNASTVCLVDFLITTLAGFEPRSIPDQIVSEVRGHRVNVLSRYSASALTLSRSHRL